MDDAPKFQWADYVLFAITIVISIFIGVYYALSGGKQRTTSEYLLAGRQMSVLPVAISLFVSFESSIMMLGLPAETYMYGIQVVIGVCTSFLANLVAAFIVPRLMYPLNITSTYEYLELRFESRFVRLLASAVGIVNDLWYMGIVLFGPAVALQAVTGFPLWMSIGGLAVVAVLYTTIGGLKAVIWTDVFQTFIMFAGIFAVLIKGTMVLGGPKAVWDTAEKGGRLEFFNFDIDPKVRHTFWNLTTSLFVRGFAIPFKQSTIQRICSTPTLKDARRVLLFMAPAALTVSLLASYEGIVCFAYYANKQCDPFASKQLTDPNQIVPFIVLDIFHSMPGMPGLFVAALFSASLSTLSSCLSGLSALFLTDFVHPVVSDMPEWKATLVAKSSVVVFGALACGIAWLVSLIGGPLQQISSVILSSFTGPLVGIFFLGCFCPRATAKGVIIGSCVSLALTMWVSLGISFSPSRKRTPYLPPASTDGCYFDGLTTNATVDLLTSPMVANFTSQPLLDTGMMTEPSIHDDGPHGVEKLYSISYTLVSLISTLSAFGFGYAFSLITGPNKPGDVNPRYLLPVSDSLLICLPKVCRRQLASLGTQFMHEEKVDDRTLPPTEHAGPEGTPMMNMDEFGVCVESKTGANNRKHSDESPCDT